MVCSKVNEKFAQCSFWGECPVRRKTKKDTLQQKRTLCQDFPFKEIRKETRRQRNDKASMAQNRNIHTATQNRNKNFSEEIYFYAVQKLPSNAIEAYAKLRISKGKKQLEINATEDTGVMSNLQPKNMLKKLIGVPLKTTAVWLFTFGGGKIKQERICQLGVRFHNRFVEATFHDINSKGLILLGLQTSWKLSQITQNLGIKMDTPTTREHKAHINSDKKVRIHMVWN